MSDTGCQPYNCGRMRRRIWYLAAILTIAALPLIFRIRTGARSWSSATINVMLAIGLDFILGYAGQLNLGHSAFYGIGAYVSTLLIMNLAVPFWLAFGLGVAASGIAEIALAIFAVRLRGHYLAIASLGCRYCHRCF